MNGALSLNDCARSVAAIWRNYGKADAEAHARNYEASLGWSAEQILAEAETILKEART